VELDLLDHPALPLVLELEQAGFQLRLAPPDRLQVVPGSQLTEDQRRLLIVHKRAVVMVLRCCDAGVVARRDAFRQQLEAVSAPVVPAFLYRPGIPYAPGVCFSCGDANERRTYGRCWRCALAWRLACRLPVSPDVAEARDHARVA